MAAPHISGVASLLYSLEPSLTPAQVLQALQDTAALFPSGSTCTTALCGSGIANASAAVHVVSSAPTNTPTAIATNSPTPTATFTPTPTPTATAKPAGASNTLHLPIALR